MEFVTSHWINTSRNKNYRMTSKLVAFVVVVVTAVCAIFTRTYYKVSLGIILRKEETASRMRYIGSS